jgi:hypothetical protein
MAGLNDFDAGFMFEGVNALDVQTITAGGAGDGAYDTNGEILDMQGFDSPESAIIVVGYKTTLASTETLSLAVKIEHGDDSGLADAADYDWGGAEQDFGVLATGVETDLIGAVLYSAKLAGLKRYWRVAVKPTLSASGTDTVAIIATAALGPGDESPPA